MIRFELMDKPDAEFIDKEDAHYVAMEVAWANQDVELYHYHYEVLLVLFKELVAENSEDMGEMLIVPESGQEL